MSNNEISHWQHGFAFLGGGKPIDLPTSLDEVEYLVDILSDEYHLLKNRNVEVYTRTHHLLDCVQVEMMKRGISDHELPLTEDYLLNDWFPEIPELLPLNSLFEGLIILIDPTSISENKAHNLLNSIKLSFIELYKITEATEKSVLGKQVTKARQEFGSLGGEAKKEAYKTAIEERDNAFRQLAKDLRKKNPRLSKNAIAGILVGEQPDEAHPLSQGRIRKIPDL